MGCAAQAAEAKAQRKEEKKQLRAQQKVALDAGKDGSHGQDSDDAEGEEGGFNGVATLAGPTKSSSKSTTRGAPVTNGLSGSAPASTTETNGAPLLLNPDLPHLAAVLDKADVVIEVLDARDPLSYRSRALEARVASKKGQKLLLVLNKIGVLRIQNFFACLHRLQVSIVDACPREPTAAWAAHLRLEHPTLLYRAASSFLPPPAAHDPTKGKGKRIEPSDDAWGLDAISNLLGHWAQEKTGEGPLHVAVVGLANVRSYSFPLLSPVLNSVLQSGKSAFINSLARRSILEVYMPSSSTNNPTTTPHALEVTLELDGVSILFIDTPGLAWEPSEVAPPEEEKERRRAQDVLLRNKGRIDRLKDPLPALSYIVSRAETEDLMVFYALPAFAKGDVDAFLMGVARAQGLIKKVSQTSISHSFYLMHSFSFLFSGG
jgi:nuclear GTP-binding protein